MTKVQLIPEEVLILACNKTISFFKKQTDSWGEREACYCRDQCGADFKYVETDWIRHESINLRKQGKLDKVRSGNGQRPYKKPEGRYANYLASPHWLEYREIILEFWGHTCALNINHKGRMDVHHRTYDHLGFEGKTDCIVLCEACHKRFHHQLPDGNEIMNRDDMFVGHQ